MLLDIHPTLLDALIKVTLVLAFGCALNLALWRAAAATRHLIWLLTLSAALALPMLCAALPGWHVLPARNLPVVIAAKGQANAADVRPLFAPPAIPRADLSRAPDPTISRERTAAAQTETSFVSTNNPRAAAPMSNFHQIDFVSTSLGLAIIWSGGCLLLLSRIIASWIALRRLASRSITDSDGQLLRLLAETSRDLNLHRPVRLLLSDDRAMPMTWGILRPIILLPAAAANWPPSRLRPVLLHELAHIKRRDALAQLLGQIAGAIYWFHPLAWLAARGMTREQERSADDLVLAAHEPPAGYASLLLELAANASSARYGGAINMARPIALEGRLRAVLDPMRRRGGLSVTRVIAGLLVTFAIAAPLAALRAQAQLPATPSTQPKAPLITYKGHVLSPDGKPVANAEVVLQNGRHTDAARTRSATDGSFALSAPPEATKGDFITLAVRAAGMGYGSARIIAGSDNVVQIWPSSSVKVTLVGSDGRPATGVRIRPTFSPLLQPFQGASSSPGFLGSIYHPAQWTDETPLITDAAGSCIVTMLPRLSQTQFEVDKLAYAQPSGKQRIQTGAGAESEPMTIVLNRAGVIIGRITDGANGKPVAGIHVVGAGGKIVSNERGEYRFEQVRPGKYVMRLDESQDIGWTAAFRKDVEVVEGKTTADQDFVLIKGTVVSGRLIEEDTGRGVPGALIAAVEPETGQYPDHTETDAQGRYALRVPPGPMRIYMATSAPEGYTNAEFDGRGDRPSQVNAIDGQDVTLDLKLTLKPGKPVTGRVIGPDGQPIDGASVEVRDAQASIVSGSSIVESDDHGEFRFRAITPGSQLSARSGSMGTLEPLAVEGGEQNVTLKMAANVNTTLTGRVLDRSGKAIENARVSLSVFYGQYGFRPSGTPTTMSDANGRFTIKYLTPVGKFSLQIDAEGYARINQDIPYKPGEAVCDLGEIRMAK